MWQVSDLFSEKLCKIVTRFLCKTRPLQWRIQDFSEGAPTPEGASIYYLTNFSENCMKMKKFRAGKARPSCPLDATMQCQLKYKENKTIRVLSYFWFALAVSMLTILSPEATKWYWCRRNNPVFLIKERFHWVHRVQLIWWNQYYMN